MRSCALDTLVQIYHHVGVKVRIDLSRRGLPAAKMALLSSKFDEIDQKTNAVPDLEVCPLPSAELVPWPPSAVLRVAMSGL